MSMSSVFVCDVPRGLVYAARFSAYPKSVEAHEPDLDLYLEGILEDGLLNWRKDGEFDYIGYPASTSQWEPCVFVRTPDFITKGLGEGGVQRHLNDLWHARRAEGRLDDYAPDECPDPWAIEWEEVNPSAVWIPDKFTPQEGA